MAGNSNGKNFRQKLDESRNLEELRISNFLDHIQISNLEWDRGVSENTTSTNLIPSIIQVLKSQDYRPGSSVVDLNSSRHQLSDKLDPISKECSFNTTLPATKNLGIEMDFIPNECEDLPSQKKSSLRSWKCILQSSHNQASIDDSPNLPCSTKHTSSEYSSLDSHLHKKKILSMDSLSIPHSIAGGTPLASPPP
nr:hypothetical protein CFP56_01547 [Quercus suber]